MELVTGAVFKPHHFESKQGERFLLREIRAEDEGAFLDAFKQLSSESRYTRFMSAVRELSPATLERATHPDAAREFALVVLHTGPQGDHIVAGGRWVACDEPGHCEYAVTVVDGWQGHGIGRELLSALRDSAEERGFEHLDGYVMSTNQAMRKLGARLGFHDAAVPGDATVRMVTLALNPDAKRANAD